MDVVIVCIKDDIIIGLADKYQIAINKYNRIILLLSPAAELIKLKKKIAKHCEQKN